MDMITIAAGAYVLGMATAAAALAIHQRSLKQAVMERRAEDAVSMEKMQERLDVAEARAMNGVELAQHRQLQDVYRAGYLQGYQIAWSQRTVSGCRR